MPAPLTQPPLWTRPFILVCLAHFILNVAFHAVMPAFPLLMRDRFHLSGLFMGIAVASYTMSAILTRPPTGYCLDRFGRKRIYLCSFFLFGLVYFLYPLAGGVFSVTLTRFVHGALWGVAMGAAITVAVDTLPWQRRGEGIGYFGLGMIVGMAVGPALGIHLAATRGYDFLFGAAAFMTLLGWTFLLFVPFPDTPRRIQPFSLSTLLEKSSLPVSLATLVFCIPFCVVLNYTALHARDVPGASAGSFYLFLALGTGLTRLFSGRIYDRSGPGGVMLLAYGLLLAGCAVLALAAGAFSFSAGGLIMGMGFGIAVPVVQAMVNALVPPERRGAANATLMTAFDLGICLGLMLMGQAQALLGWQATYAALFVCVLVSALLFRCFALPHYRRGLAAQRGQPS